MCRAPRLLQFPLFAGFADPKALFRRIDAGQMDVAFAISSARYWNNCTIWAPPPGKVCALTLAVSMQGLGLAGLWLAHL